MGGVNGFTSCFTLTTDNTQAGSANLTNWPLLVSVTRTALKTTGNGGSMTNSSGFDRWYTSDAGCTTKIPWESLQYGASTGAVVDFVLLSTLSHTAPTTIYLCVGKSSITTDQSNKVGTWVSYSQVSHLNEASNPYADATGNGFSSNAGTYPTQLTSGCAFNNCQSFVSGSSTYIQMPSSTPSATYSTLSAWAKVSSVPTTTVIFDTRVGGGGPGSVVYFSTSGGTVNFFCAPQSVGTTGSNLADGNWHYYLVQNAQTGSGQNTLFYVDGSSVASMTGGCTLIGNYHTNIGTDYMNTSGDFITGVIQEYRTFADVRGTISSWVIADYNSQKPSSTFLTVTPPKKMADFTSKATGNWSAMGQTTWNEPGRPSFGHSVLINSPHVVTVDVDSTGGDGTDAGVSIASGATIAVPTGITLTVNGGLDNAGTLDLQGGGALAFGGAVANVAPAILGAQGRTIGSGAYV